MAMTDLITRYHTALDQHLANSAALREGRGAAGLPQLQGAYPEAELRPADRRLLRRMTHAFRFSEALAALGTPDFIPTLKREIETLDTLRWILARRMNGFGSIDAPVAVMVLGADEQGEAIEARITLLYTETATVYRCPDCSGEDVVHEACEMTVRIDKRTAAATFYS
jgi:hypothetical protein